MLDSDRTHTCDSRGREAIRVETPTVEGVPPIVRAVAESAAPVLVFGETGVGKEILARILHARSSRAPRNGGCRT